MPRCLALSPMSKDKRNMPTSLTIDTVHLELNFFGSLRILKDIDHVVHKSYN